MGCCRGRVFGRHVHRAGRIARDAAAIPWSVGWQTTCTWCRSVPLGTLCDTMRWCAWSIVVNIGLGCRRSGRFGDTIRLGRWAPRGWVGLFALVKCYTCLRGASGARLLTFGQQLVCTGWGGSGSDLDGRGPTRAHKIVPVIVGVRRAIHHTAYSDTPMHCTACLRKLSPLDGLSGFAVRCTWMSRSLPAYALHGVRGDTPIFSLAENDFEARSHPEFSQKLAKLSVRHVRAMKFSIYRRCAGGTVDSLKHLRLGPQGGRRVYVRIAVGPRWQT